MKTIFRFACFAFIVLSLSAIFVAAQKTREQRTITGNYNDTTTIAPTIERIKSLKMPAGFSIAKFAEIENPRMLAVAPNGTVYVSQRDAGTLTMLKDTNGDGVADVQKVVAEKKMLHGMAIDNGKMYVVTVREVFVADMKSDGSLGELRMIINDLPDAGQHPNRTLAVQGGKLYTSVGLDVNTMRALEEALENFAGCAVVISHDRWFLDRIATHILAFEGDSKVEFFDGNYSEYEADKRRRLGVDADQPHRIKYRSLTRA
jgi:glucose/arabinose dehydrogenase